MAWATEADVGQHSTFSHYNECLSNDFVLPGGGNAVGAFRGGTSVTGGVTFVDTGVNANLGPATSCRRWGCPRGRRDLSGELCRRRSATCRFPRKIEHFEKSGKDRRASSAFVPTVSYHYVSHEPGGNDRGKIGDASKTHPPARSTAVSSFFAGASSTTSTKARSSWSSRSSASLRNGNW